MNDVCGYCARVLSTNKSDSDKIVVVDEIVDLIVKEDTLKEIFTRGRTHAQLVQRSEQLIRLLMIKNALAPDRQLVWEASEMNDIDQEIALFKVLSGAAGDMKKDDRAFYIDKVFKVDKSQLIDRHIELVTEICSSIKPMGS